MTTTFEDVIDYAGNRMTQQEAHVLFELANARLKHLRSLTAAENLASLQQGATVRLSGLKPKYLNGLTGTVQSIESGKVRVKLDDISAMTASRYVGLDHTLLAPASTVSLVV